MFFVSFRLVLIKLPLSSTKSIRNCAMQSKRLDQFCYQHQQNGSWTSEYGCASIYSNSGDHAECTYKNFMQNEHGIELEKREARKNILNIYEIKYFVYQLRIN